MKRKNEIISLGYLIPRVKPEIRELIAENFNQVLELVENMRVDLPEDSFEHVKSILDGLQDRIEMISSDIARQVRSLKSSTKEGFEATARLARFFETRLPVLGMLARTWSETGKESYLLQFISELSTLLQESGQALHDMKNSPYKHLLMTILGCILAFLPFLNIISLILGVHQVLQKDYRTILSGMVLLGLFFLQMLFIGKLAF